MFEMKHFDNIDEYAKTLFLYVRRFCIDMYYALNTLFTTEDYHIYSAYLEYKADDMVMIDKPDTITDEWIEEAKSWNSVDHWYFWDITSEFKKTNGEFLNRILDDVPESVHEYVFTIKYHYGGKNYRYVSREQTCDWPPEPIDGMKFIMPIAEAWCVNSRGKKVRDITKTIRKARGPRGDFHGQDVMFRDIIKYDQPRILITTLAGSDEYSENDSVLDSVI
jgi:hypothetical protein